MASESNTQGSEMTTRRSMRKGWSRAFISGTAFIAVVATAADTGVRVVDQDGQPLADAVVALTPSDGSAPAVVAGTEALIDQRGLQFIPSVLPIQAGTRVLMPNSDQVRHHVYSFSPAKAF